MAVDIKDLINDGICNINLNVADPSTSGYDAGEGTTGLATNGTVWIKKGSSTTDWELVNVYKTLGVADPTSTGVDAPINTEGFTNETPPRYFKKTGAATTDWTELGAGSGGSGGAELVVELKLNSTAPRAIVSQSVPYVSHTQFLRSNIIADWLPVEVSDPQGLWDSGSGTFTAGEDGVYIFDIADVDVVLKGSAPAANKIVASSTYATDFAAKPRGISLKINGVPYLIHDLTPTSVTDKSIGESNFRSIISTGTFDGFRLSSRSFNWAVPLTAGDVCKISTTMFAAGSGTPYQTSKAVYLLPSVGYYTTYTGGHAGPVDSKIKIYKM